MKRFIIPLAAGVAVVAGMTSCNEAHTTYSEAEYVMFTDTLSTHVVVQDKDASFTIPVASTVACDYDRTFAVEVIDEGSNAIEGYHYKLKSNTFTIKAGSRASSIEVQGIYDNIEDTDSLGFCLKLVMPEQLCWDHYGDRTKVTFSKSCPFNIEDFATPCLVTSTFLVSYPGENTDIQRLIDTEISTTEENTIILKDFLFPGYDIRLTFDPSDPANPRVSVPEDQVLSDELSVFGQIHGDNKILVTTSSYYDSYFNACQHFVALWTQVYVRDMDVMIDTVGHFYNIIEWISQEEADRLRREEGM